MELRKNIIDLHVKGKDYKSISKQADVPVTTAAQIIQDVDVAASRTLMKIKRQIIVSSEQLQRD